MPALCDVEDKMQRYQWKYKLSPAKQKEYYKYLKKLREENPTNTWRIKRDKYYKACQNGFMHMHCTLDNFLKPRV